MHLGKRSLKFILLFTTNTLFSDSLSPQTQALTPRLVNKKSPLMLIDPTPSQDEIDPNLHPYKKKESLDFDVYHMTMLTRIFCGSAKIATEGLYTIWKKPALAFKIQATSAKWYEWIVKIDDSVSGYFDLETNKTISIELKKREGTYTQDMYVLFDYRNPKQETIRVVENNVTKEYDIPQTQNTLIDPYSIIFLIRRVLNKKKTIVYNIYDDGFIYTFQADVTDEARVKLHGHTIDALKVRILTKVSGAMEQKSGIFVYFTKTPNRVPFLVEGDVKVGSFRLELKKDQLDQILVEKLGPVTQ